MVRGNFLTVCQMGNRGMRVPVPDVGWIGLSYIRAEALSSLVLGIVRPAVVKVCPGPVDV